MNDFLFRVICWNAKHTRMFARPYFFVRRCLQTLIETNCDGYHPTGRCTSLCGYGIPVLKTKWND